MSLAGATALSSPLSAELSAEAGLFELMWLLGGGLGIVIVSYAISRALRGARHGVSIRLQLFFAMSFSSLCTATLIGTWALKRIEARAAEAETLVLDAREDLEEATREQSELDAKIDDAAAVVRSREDNAERSETELRRASSEAKEAKEGRA